MSETLVDGFTFDVPAGWRVLKYDDCTYYRRHFNGLASSKAADLLALDPQGKELWIVEIKDYRHGRRRSKPEHLFDECAAKIRDTLAGLAAARTEVNNDPESRIFAAAAMRAKHLRVALLLEQPQSPSRLFPQVIDPKTGTTKLKKALRSVDPHPFLGSASALAAKTKWAVTTP